MGGARFPHPWIQDYYNYLITEKGFSARTADAYLHDLRVFLRFLEERGTELDAVDIYLLREFNRHLQEERDNVHITRARKLSALRGFYRYLLDSGLIDDDPTVKLRPPKVPRKQPLFLSAAEARRFLEAAEKHGPDPVRDKAIFSMFLYTGCRLGELVEPQRAERGFRDGQHRAVRQRRERAGRAHAGRAGRGHPALFAPAQSESQVPSPPPPVPQPVGIRHHPPRRALPGQAHRAGRRHPAGTPSARTSCATRWRRSCWSATRTCAPSRSCWATSPSPRRSATPTSSTSA